MSSATILAAAVLALPFVPEVKSATTEVRPVADFQSIEFRGAGHLVIRAGEPAAVAVSASPGALPSVLTRVRDGVLVVEQKGSFWQGGNGAITVDIHVPRLARLTVNGAAVADLSGLHGGRTVLELNGASRLTARGTVDQLVTRFDGASRADLTRLVAGQVDLSVNGAAQVRLPAQTPLVTSRDSVGSLTSAHRMDRWMLSTNGGDRILR